MIRARQGFTLVEILVSAIIIGIAIVAVVAVARKSREMDITFNHHRKARVLIDSCFESAEWQYPNYDNFANRQDSVLVDPRSAGGQVLKGLLSISVALDSTAGSVGGNVRYKNVNATLTWMEPEGTQSVSMKKSVAQYEKF
jgi:prepilin-type N-terminal cleavage/methylation domain-containing protein